MDEARRGRPLAALETVAEGCERGNGNGFVDDVAPGVVLPAGDDVVLRVDVAPDRALDVGKRIVRRAADLDREEVVDPIAPDV